MGYTFEDSLGRICNRIASCMGDGLNYRFKEHNIDLSRDEWVVLAYLYEFEGLKQNQIAEAVGRDKTAINRLVDGLERKDLVYRKQCDNDKRVNQVRLTEAGTQMQQRLHGIADDTLKDAWRGIPDEEREQCLSVLKMVLTNLSCPTLPMNQ